MARKKRVFTAAYKSEVVQLFNQSGKTITQIAREMDLTPSSVRNWVKQAEVDAGRDSPGALTTAEREELTRLRRELRTVKMEREILKKAAAFFAKESL